MTHQHSTYRITNRISGRELGLYPGATEEEAVEAMHRDAGYDSSAAAAEALGKSLQELRAELIVEPGADALTLLTDTSDARYYAETEYGYELTEAGADLAEAAGLTVDVDAYGQAYVVEVVQL